LFGDICAFLDISALLGHSESSCAVCDAVLVEENTCERECISICCILLKRFEPIFVLAGFPQSRWERRWRHTECNQSKHKQSPVDGAHCSCSLGGANSLVSLWPDLEEISNNVPSCCFFGKESKGRQLENNGDAFESEVYPIEIYLGEPERCDKDLGKLSVLIWKVRGDCSHVAQENQCPGKDEEGHA
jgi:hypothetical protein